MRIRDKQGDLPCLDSVPWLKLVMDSLAISREIQGRLIGVPIIAKEPEDVHQQRYHNTPTIKYPCVHPIAHPDRITISNRPQKKIICQKSKANWREEGEIQKGTDNSLFKACFLFVCVSPAETRSL
ncbi:hypothetical protein TNCV_3082401 [Trichonephila clavipes]|nr:hypothetical protein TNCV_3082401 [Trichonephila clavipes]